MFEEKCDFTVALLFKIVDDGSTAQLAFAKDLFYFLQVFILKRNLEQVVSVVNWKYFDFTLTCQRKDLVPQEKRQVNWLLNAFEGA